MLILLDIDGVMVPAKGWKTPEILSDGFPAFSNTAVSALQHLISKDVTIVLTTSHKSNYSIEEWKNIFKNRNLNIENLKTLPENLTNISRKDEILNWLSINNIDKDFMIIDDDKSLNDLPVSLKKKLIQPSSYIGLTDEHSAIAKNIMEEKL